MRAPVAGSYHREGATPVKGPAVSDQPARPKIYLLPGLDGTGLLFAPLLGRLPAGAAQVVRYPFDHSESWEALVDVVRDQVDTGAPFVLFAESFSGPVAVRFLRACGERCVGLLACATFLSNPAPVGLRVATLPGVSRLVPARPPRWAVRRLLLSRRAPVELVGSVARVISTVPAATVARRLRLVRGLAAAPTRLPMPVVYVRGDQDRLVGARSEAEFLRAIPGATGRRAGGPHLLAQENPGAVAALLLDLCQLQRPREPSSR